MATGRTDVVRNVTVWLVIAIVALIAASEFLAMNRIFQVDELQNVFVARLLATHASSAYEAGAPLMLLGPVSWIAVASDHSAVVLRMERLLFVALFWLNLCLIVRCAGLTLRSRSGLLALLLVGTLEPLWDYGFEIRHDNLLLTIILLAWLAARPAAEGGRSHPFAVGFLAVVAQFVAIKAFVYLLPFVGFTLLVAWREPRRLGRNAASVIGGAASALLAVYVVHRVAGTWTLYVKNITTLGRAAVHVARFSSAPTFARLLHQTPLFVIASIAAAAAAVVHARRQPPLSRESLLPELGLVAVALLALLLNPTPFPYNLVLLVPQAAVLCLRQLEWIVVPRRSRTVAIAFTAAVVIHCALWAAETRRHVLMTNARQTELMATAEMMTDPVEHAVFDGSGLVPTRHPPGYHWLIHSFTIGHFHDGTYPAIRTQLAEGRTAVIVPNYRLTWLAREDQQFIADHYVQLAADFLVPGGVLTTAGSGPAQWNCLVPGRYYVAAADRSGVVVDGRPAQAGPLTFSRGAHTVAVMTGARAYVVWLGPHVRSPPVLGPGDPSRVFVNWY
jgi:hypothetical protein